MLHLPPEKIVEYHFHCCLSTSFLEKTAHFCSGLSREGSVVAMVALIGAGVAVSVPLQECSVGPLVAPGVRSPLAERAEDLQAVRS